MLEEILNYVTEIKGMLFCEGQFCPPNIDKVVEMLKKSNANKFCQNPKQYFEELSGKIHY